jgi:hypothetical protein
MINILDFGIQGIGCTTANTRCVLTEKLKSETFIKEAKNKNNEAPLKFIDFFDYEFKNLRNESVVKLLFEKRNVTIHRTDPALRGEFVANITEEIRISENVNYIISDEDGNIKQQSNSKQNEKEHSKPLEYAVKAKWFFSDYPQTEVPVVCQCLLERMRDFVRNIDEKFPIGHETEKQLTIAVIKATKAGVIVLQEIESNKSSEQAPPPGKRIKRYTSKEKPIYE